jgi:hypothetical protein
MVNEWSVILFCSVSLLAHTQANTKVCCPAAFWKHVRIWVRNWWIFSSWQGRQNQENNVTHPQPSTCYQHSFSTDFCLIFVFLTDVNYSELLAKCLHLHFFSFVKKVTKRLLKLIKKKLPLFESHAWKNKKIKTLKKAKCKNLTFHCRRHVGFRLWANLQPQNAQNTRMRIAARMKNTGLVAYRDKKKLLDCCKEIEKLSFFTALALRCYEVNYLRPLQVRKIL